MTNKPEPRPECPCGSGDPAGDCQYSWHNKEAGTPEPRRAKGQMEYDKWSDKAFVNRYEKSWAGTPETPLDKLKERAKKAKAKIDYSDVGSPHLMEETASGPQRIGETLQEWIARCGMEGVEAVLKQEREKYGIRETASGPPDDVLLDKYADMATDLADGATQINFHNFHGYDVWRDVFTNIRKAMKLLLEEDRNGRR